MVKSTPAVAAPAPVRDRRGHWEEAGAADEEEDESERTGRRKGGARNGRRAGRAPLPRRRGGHGRGGGWARRAGERGGGLTGRMGRQ
ncbi:UNVERIFIED_CONTAM: hypothetical protein Slati_0745400 [Sesamum latifolium]|uniref:Pr1-like protein n=1 Tax=Sesamum latifolium TaxID=2727402 RepID=A0AAW2XIR0_9LAMI